MPINLCHDGLSVIGVTQPYACFFGASRTFHAARREPPTQSCVAAPLAFGSLDGVLPVMDREERFSVVPHEGH